MKIVFFTTAHNSLSQRAFVELVDRGHTVTVVIASSEEVMLEAVEREQPDLIVAPMLKKVIPASIWQQHTCLIVHPGIKGDRGPSSLDWAILHAHEEWGVTLLQADAEMDAGAIWAWRTFAIRGASKSHLYRHEVTEAAIEALLETIAKRESNTFVPEPLDYSREDVRGCLQASMKQADRAIDWAEPSASILRKIRCPDSFPGIVDTVLGMPCYLYGAHEEDVLRGRPGEIIAKRDGAICRATGDGAIWITHLKQKGPDGQPSFKLPATQVLGDRLAHVPEVPLAVDQAYDGRTYREIWYEERQAVGYLHFDFYNGAMSTDQCQRLREAFLLVRQRPTKVIVLMGGADFWSNGIHLNAIEAADDPAHESWRNIQAMNDLVRELITTDSHLVISALQGNAGAGGVILALAADFVYARKGLVLNPHYKRMVVATISSSKDIDGISTRSAGNLFLGLPSFLPSTAAAVMEILERTHTPLEGKRVVVISRSNVVGKPLGLMLLQKNATVTICHSCTTNLAALTRQADVLVAAAGRARMVTAEMVKPGAVVIDVGINALPDGSLVGDVDFASVREVAGAITPVPGGVGPLTNVALLKQCVQAAWQLGGEKKELKTA